MKDLAYVARCYKSNLNSLVALGINQFYKWCAAPPSPSDPTVKRVADKLASFVAKNGRQFEHITRQKNPGDTPFKYVLYISLYALFCSAFTYWSLASSCAHEIVFFLSIYLAVVFFSDFYLTKHAQTTSTMSFSLLKRRGLFHWLGILKFLLVVCTWITVFV